MTVPKVQSGQAWREKAVWRNAIADAANAHAAGMLGGGVDVPRTQWQSDVRLVRNDSGADRDAGDVLAIDGVVVTPEDLELDGLSPSISSRQYFQRWGPELVFIGVEPDLATPVLLNQHVGHFAILLEPLPNGKAGLAVFSGIAVCPIDLVYEDHPFADVADGTCRLTSNWYGAAEILYTQRLVNGVVATPTGGETITWYAAVRLGNFRTQELEAIVDEASGIAYNASGTVEVYWGGTLTSPLQTLEVDFKGLGTGNTLADNTRVDIRYHRDTQSWRVKGANCQ